MLEHTKEPWQVHQRGTAGLVELYTGDHVNGRVELIGEIGTLANAERIKACVNACTGVPTSGLYNVPITVLIAALEEAVELRVKLWRNGDLDGDNDLSDSQVAAKDIYARKWLAITQKARGYSE